MPMIAENPTIPTADSAGGSDAKGNHPVYFQRPSPFRAVISYGGKESPALSIGSVKPPLVFRMREPPSASRTPAMRRLQNLSDNQMYFNYISNENHACSAFTSVIIAKIFPEIKMPHVTGPAVRPTRSADSAERDIRSGPAEPAEHGTDRSNPHGPRLTANSSPSLRFSGTSYSSRTT